MILVSWFQWTHWWTQHSWALFWLLINVGKWISLSVDQHLYFLLSAWFERWSISWSILCWTVSIERVSVASSQMNRCAEISRVRWMEFFFVIASSNDWFAFVPKNISCLSNSFKRILHRWIGFFFNRSVPLDNFCLNCILSIGINLHWQIFSSPRCLSLRESSPIDYHQICGEQRDLLCFVDDVSLCLCVENPIRVECFISDDNLDHCSRCLFGVFVCKEIVIADQAISCVFVVLVIGLTNVNSIVVRFLSLLINYFPSIFFPMSDGEQ